jgi:hypothetical protein
LAGGGRFIKSHESRSATPTDLEAKVIVLLRDPREIAVSYYRQLMRETDWRGSREEFFRAFVSQGVAHYGSWIEHVRGWLEYEGDALRIWYSDVLSDPEDALRKCLEFVGVSVRDRDVRRARSLSTPEEMQKREVASEVMQARVSSRALDGNQRFVSLDPGKDWRLGLSRDEVVLLEGAFEPWLSHWTNTRDGT